MGKNSSPKNLLLSFKVWFFKTFQTVVPLKRKFPRQLSICCNTCLIRRQQIESYRGLKYCFKNQTLVQMLNRSTMHFWSSYVTKV